MENAHRHNPVCRHRRRQDSDGGRRPERTAHHVLLFGREGSAGGKWWLAGALVFALLFAAGTILVFTRIDWSGVARTVARLPAPPLVATMALLPLIGFPILPVYLIAGARFGPVGGGIVVTLVTVAHLAGTYAIARTVLRRPLQRLLSRWHAHLPAIPRDEEAAVSLIAALVPGLPYVIRNYILAMAGLRLRVYLWVCLPIYVARSYVAILLGNLGGRPDRARLFVLVSIELVKGVVCALVIWRLRVHHRRFHGRGGSESRATPFVQPKG